MMKNLARIAVAILVAGLNSVPCIGQVEQFKVLVPSAEEIVIGKVQSLEGKWDAKGKKILTTVVIQPVEVLRGNPLPTTVNVVVLGGTVGKITMKVSDAPQFEPDELVFLLLRRGSAGEYQLVGYGDGKIGLRNRGAEYRSREVSRMEVDLLIQEIRSGAK